MDSLIQPHMTWRAAEEESSPPTPIQNQSLVTLTKFDTALPEPADSVEDLSATDKMADVQPCHTYQHKLPRKKKEDEEPDAEVVEVRPGYIDHERFPRKQVDEELGAVTLPATIRQERLPRKKVAAQVETVQNPLT